MLIRCSIPQYNYYACSMLYYAINLSPPPLVKTLFAFEVTIESNGPLYKII